MKYKLLFFAIFFIFPSCNRTPTGVLGLNGRDVIKIVGSSTVYPFAATVAEEFGMISGHKTPIIESTGTGGGFKLFCSGIGPDYPDAVDASRKIKRSELHECNLNKIYNIIEVPIGYDGIALANSRYEPSYRLTTEELFLAVARFVPSPDKKSLVPNYYRNWREINPNLPNNPITIYGPSPNSGTRDAFIELVMNRACDNLPTYRAIFPESNKAERYKNCGMIRNDGPYIESGENYQMLVGKLDANRSAFAIFGFSFLEQNYTKIHASSIDGFLPSPESISNGQYPVSRQLFIYVKGEHLGMTTALDEFIRELTSEGAIGKQGYLVFKGIIPLPDRTRLKIQNDVMQKLSAMNLR